MEQEGVRTLWPSMSLILLSLPALSSLSSAGLSASPPPAPAAESSADRLALLSFKSLISSSQALSSWGNTSLHFCQWRGVYCSDLGGEPRVTALELQSVDLAGKLSPSLANLTFLQTLNFTNNNLRGSIPHELAYLSHLDHLDLSRNHLTGSIPPSIRNLSGLTQILLYTNSLSGSIPAGIGNLSSLTWLDLYNNSLTGAIPSSIGNLARLRFLALHRNQLSGTIPSEIGNLANLGQLFLGGNQLEGTIPRSFGHLKFLYKLFLSNNKIEANDAAEWSFIDDLSNCTLLTVLDISANHLSGILPKSIANLSEALIWLNFYHNQVAGSIPAEIGNLINLDTIKIHSNLLTGPIPATLGSLGRLVLLDMSGNYFAGEIPANLGNLSELNRLNLASNELNGSIPPSLGQCRLEKLNLANNKLTGILPAEILSIPSLSIILNVSGNSLTGPLPPQIGNLRNIQTIDVSNNKISGEIPSSIAQCQVVENLHLQGNIFEGYIPLSFRELKQLQVLDVSRNNLSGHLPDCFRRFQSLTFLDLSYNNFDGEVPTDGVFSNASAFSVVGNNKLCGGIPKLRLPSCSEKRHRLAAKLIAIISVAGGIFFCFIFLVSRFACRRWSRKSRRATNGAVTCIKEQHRQVSFAELLRATDGFSPANLIGTGSFGSVYKGTMDWENHKDVAVKVLNLRQKGALKTFVAECNVLRSIRHRNLIKVLTSCSTVDFRGNEFKALIFEFLPNGSLEKWLHPQVDGNDTKPGLSLIQRLNISIDIASALAYLHHRGTTPVIHCDIKPSNVLLDHGLVAHVGDFGLAKFLVKNERSTSSITLKGSIGYVAPEYGMSNKVSAQGDAYSYGILVLEMFSGKRPTDDAFNDELNLRKYVEMALPHRVVEIIDPKLPFEGEAEEEEDRSDLSRNESRIRSVECIISVLRIGMSCSRDSPKERMNMEDVTRELQSIRDAFLGRHVGMGKAIYIN